MSGGGWHRGQAARRARLAPRRTRPRRCPTHRAHDRSAGRPARRDRCAAMPRDRRSQPLCRIAHCHLGPGHAPRAAGPRRSLSDRGWRRAPPERSGTRRESHMTRRFSLLVDDRPETLLRVTGLCLRRRADVVELRYGRSRARAAGRGSTSSWPSPSATAAGSPSGSGRSSRYVTSPSCGASLGRARWTTSTSCSSAGCACSRPATSTRRRCRSRKAAALEPEKTSIREALGRAYFRSRRFEEAAAEFEAVVERAPTNDYALFCLGRALMQRPARRGAQAARARRLPAAGPARLPDLPRSRARAARRAACRARPVL